MSGRTEGQFRVDFPPRATHHRRGDGEVPCLRHDQGDRPDLRQELVRAFTEQVLTSSSRSRAPAGGDGIGPKRADSIVAAWADQKAIREIMIFLHRHGVGTSRAVRIFKTYERGRHPADLGEPVPAWRVTSAALQERRPDRRKLGIEKTAMIRARAGIGYALTEAMDEGHCGLPLADLVPMAVTLLYLRPTAASADAISGITAIGAKIPHTPAIKASRATGPVGRRA